ncbi:MAG: DUF4097 family beta strand repeat protein [Acidobacteria bacterium]|nr:DUF4097 family beta strand repeat protein [Acidobacteriota bacterium]
MRPRIHAVASVGLALGCAAALSACEVNLNTEGLTSKETRTFKVTGEAELTLDTFDGSIDIHSWDRDEVEVEIEKRAMEQSLIDQMTIEADQQGNRIVVRVTGPARPERRGLTVGVYYSPAARLRVAVPRKGSIHARTEDGTIRVEDLEGRLVFQSGDGSITANRVSGEIEIRTADGAIRLEQAAGRLQLDTDDGSITVEGEPAVLRAKTADGAIRVRLRDETTMADAWDLSTRDGSVTLTLPALFNAQIDAETRDGSVRSSHPGLTIEPGDGERRSAPREVRARMGDGGPVLKVRTGDGSIRFER